MLKSVQARQEEGRKNIVPQDIIDVNIPTCEKKDHVIVKPGEAKDMQSQCMFITTCPRNKLLFSNKYLFTSYTTSHQVAPKGISWLGDITHSISHIQHATYGTIYECNTGVKDMSQNNMWEKIYCKHETLLLFNSSNLEIKRFQM